MAMVWIEEIHYHCTAPMTLLQSDPSKHPVINGHQYNHEPIHLHTGDNLAASWFVIPWADFGRLDVDYAGKKSYWVVGPNSATSGDYLRCFNGANDKLIAELPIGPRGNEAICSVSLRLVCNDDKPVEFQIKSTSGLGPIDAQKLFDDIMQVAKFVAGFFKPGGGQ